MAPEVFKRIWTRLEKYNVAMAVETKTLLYQSAFDVLSIYGPYLFRDLGESLEVSSIVQIQRETAHNTFH